MNDIFSFILAPKIGWILISVQIIFVFFSLVFLVSIFVLLLKNTWLKRRYLEDMIEIATYRPFGVKKTFKQWAKILKRMETDKEAEYKLAIIEADGLLDEVFGKMGFRGETIGEKLKQIDSVTLPNIDQVWEVHKVRNNIVHDPDYRLALDKAKKVLAVYERALRDLELF